MTLTKNEDGTYTKTVVQESEVTYTREDLENEKATLQANITTYNTRIAEIDALIIEMDAVDAAEE